MLKCLNCGCENEIAVGLIACGRQVKLACLACETDRELTESELQQIATEQLERSLRKGTVEEEDELIFQSWLRTVELTEDELPF